MARLDRHENKIIFTANKNGYGDSTMQATGMKFWMNTHFNTAHLKTKIILEKNEF